MPICLRARGCELKLGTGGWKWDPPTLFLTSDATNYICVQCTQLCTHNNTHTRTHTPQSHWVVPSQLAGRGHDTHPSLRFDQKELQRWKVLLMKSRDSFCPPPPLPIWVMSEINAATFSAHRPVRVCVVFFCVCLELPFSFPSKQPL